MRWLSSLLVLPLAGLISAASIAGDRLLVVIEEASEKTKYSQLWGDLTDRGFSISYDTPKNDKLALVRHGERIYDHVILLPPKSKAYGPSLSPQVLLDFTSKEGNILLALSGESSIPSAIQSLLVELDIQTSPDRSSVTVDHFGYDTLSAAEKHDTLLLSKPTPLRSDVKNFFAGEGTIAFPKAVAQTLGNTNPLLAPILKAGKNAYSYNPKEEFEAAEDPFAIGEQISLVTAMQARNNARFTVFGSVEALEDKWFDANVKGIEGKQTKTANRDFAKQVTSWAFKESGVLQVGRVEHHLASERKSSTGHERFETVGESNPKIYRVKNDVTFTIELSEYRDGKLQPPVLPSDDALQLEFSMLSPFHRLALKPVSNTTTSTLYSTTFTCPDQHGIFSFKVNYKRPFFTNIEVKEEVTVRHFAHDEWPRSWEISGGWVWIAGIWVTVAGWLAFVAIWLWSDPTKQQGSVKKVQ